MLANGPISWKSHKQSLTISSTIEAEFIAYYKAICHAVWLKNFISGLQLVDSISKPLQIYCDYDAAMRFSNNNKTSGGSKHIDIKYLVVKKRVLNQPVFISHIGTTLMLADPLTKGPTPKLFQKHVARMNWYQSQVLNSDA